MKIEYSILAIFLVPMVSVFILGINMMMKNYWDERFVYRYARMSLYLTLAAVLFTSYDYYVVRGGQAIFLELRPWFHITNYEFELQFQFDLLSLVYCFLVCVLSIVVSKFSSTYLLGERGYHRFFLLMLLFNAGNMMIILAGNIDLLIIGWEWVGFTSVLLISFFSNRNFPVKNSMYAFTTYRICDVALLTAAVLFHNYYHSSSFHHIFQGSTWPDLNLVPGPSASEIQYIGLFLIFASLAKSSQFPMSGWLSKAMEGPTPSSAIFYGGISIHLGCFLLLRCSPFIQSSHLLSVLLGLIGVITAFYGTMVGRTRSDTKTNLAYSSMTQVAIIMIEIALNLDKIALIHIFSHAVIRTFQFLRSSSLMQDFLDNPLIYENSVVKTGVQYEAIFGEKAQKWLYYFALDNFYLDTIIMRFIVNPVMAVSETLNRIEEKYCGGIRHLHPEKEELEAETHEKIS